MLCLQLIDFHYLFGFTFACHLSKCALATLLSFKIHFYVSLPVNKMKPIWFLKVSIFKSCKISRKIQTLVFKYVCTQMQCVACSVHEYGTAHSVLCLLYTSTVLYNATNKSLYCECTEFPVEVETQYVIQQLKKTFMRIKLESTIKFWNLNQVRFQVPFSVSRIIIPTEKWNLKLDWNRVLFLSICTCRLPMFCSRRN